MTANTKFFTVRSSGLTDIGKVRENNEDAWIAIPEHNVYVLADGMGGHSAGEVAARETVEKYSTLIQEKSQALSQANAKRLLFEVIQEVNSTVFHLGKAYRSLKGMGTTLCSALFVDNWMYYAHVGDSRIYLFRDRKITQLTEDHSLVQELLDLGELDHQQAEDFSKKNIITKAIGADLDIAPDIHSCLIKTDDIILMCSDGLSDLLSKSEIEKVLSLSADIDQKAGLFIQSANRRGGQDNITVILIEVKSLLQNSS